MIWLEMSAPGYPVDDETCQPKVDLNRKHRGQSYVSSTSLSSMHETIPS